MLAFPFLFSIYSAHKGNDFFAKTHFFEPNVVCG
jgi:hypothetical protein